MKVRNNIPGDQCLTFANGRSIYLSRGEVSRALTTEELNDPFLAKAVSHRRVVFHEEVEVKTESASARHPAPMVKGPLLSTEEKILEEKKDTDKTKRIFPKKSPAKEA